MLFLLSPAKKLDYDTPSHVAEHTQPLFVERSRQLIDVLKKKTPAEIGELMHLSDALSELNAQRYGAWRPKFTTEIPSRPYWRSTAMSMRAWRPPP